MLYQHYQKIKEYARVRQTDLFLACLIFLVSIGSFGLGRLSVLWPEKQPIRIENSELSTLSVVSAVKSANSLNSPNQLNTPNELGGKYVASKNGSAYHYPWCSGAKRIKEENKIWFQTKEEAESRGYKPAANCDGL